MGYTTYFDGSFRLSRKLTVLQAFYLARFSAIRHVKRDVLKLKNNWILKKLRLNSESEGEFYIGIVPPEPVLKTQADFYKFNFKHREIIKTLMLIRNRCYKNLDKSIFYKIFSHLFDDSVNNKDLQNYLDYHNTKSIQEYDEKDTVISINSSPKNQPGFWCQWIYDARKNDIIWDEGEKFYEYRAWIEYMIHTFFIPWDIILEGTVHFQGEDNDDCGNIIIEDNLVDLEYTTPDNSEDE